MAQTPEQFRRKVAKFNKVIVGLHRMGIALGPQALITVPGRHSGQMRTAPIAVVPIAGQRYIFQAYPKAAWVANVRAAESVTLSRGRRSSTVRLVELPLEERRVILHQHITNSPARVGKMLVTTGLVDTPTPEAVAAAAERIAVFRIES
ncbi:nitroreductase/quinone reductase family protein [Nocardia sp. NPDC051030]|uniref:nitroreductase/quinone reductase family protein n=1 Tax=Nocardia sp. NPDC051030 TaxID=3155162 RepID=UPI003448F1F8